MTAPSSALRGLIKGTRTTEDPFVECASCGARQELGDAFEYKAGMTAECPDCGATLTCEYEDFTRHWTWSAPK
jgi:hypothetical protein